MTEIKITNIRIDGGTQPRAEVDPFIVDDYAAAMRAGVEFPPVTVFFDGEAYWLADGFHRVAAAKAADKPIPSDVRQGTRRDAVLYSVGANAVHGLRRTNADKRRAVLTLLRDDEWRKWSDNEIARRSKVSVPTVSKHRASLLKFNSENRTYTTKHGTVTTMNTSKIGKSQPLPEPVRAVLRDSETSEAKGAIRKIAALPDKVQVEVARVAGKHDVTAQETIIMMARIAESQKKPGSNGTFGEIDRTGWIQPGDEEDAVHITDDPERVREALMKKSHTHRILASHQLINQSDNNEWYTPKRYLDAVHDVMGAVDLDPASCETANRTVRAAKIYTIEDDGFSQEWCGRVFINPPYGHDGEKHESNQARWSRRLIEQFKAGVTTEAILLVNAVPGNKWFVPLWEFMICFPDHRIRFESAQGEAGQPTHSNAFVYMGKRREKFAQVFEKFGAVAVKYGS